MSGITTVGFRRLLGFLQCCDPERVVGTTTDGTAASNGLTGIQSVALNSRVALQGLSMLGLTTVLMAVHFKQGNWF